LDCLKLKLKIIIENTIRHVLILSFCVNINSGLIFLKSERTLKLNLIFEELKKLAVAGHTLRGIGHYYPQHDVLVLVLQLSNSACIRCQRASRSYSNEQQLSD